MADDKIRIDTLYGVKVLNPPAPEIVYLGDEISFEERTYMELLSPGSFTAWRCRVATYDLRNTWRTWRGDRGQWGTVCRVLM